MNELQESTEEEQSQDPAEGYKGASMPFPLYPPPAVCRQVCVGR